MKTRPAIHIVIEDVHPAVDGGRHPIKRIAGDRVAVDAAIFRDGADKIRPAVRWRRVANGSPATGWREAPMHLESPGLDRWKGELTVEEPGHYEYAVSAFTDPYWTWVDELRRKIEGRRTDLSSEILEGAAMVEPYLPDLAEAFRERIEKPAAVLILAEHPEVIATMAQKLPRQDEVFSPPLAMLVERRRARFGSWYELFIRSQTDDPSRPGTFRMAETRLPDVAAMGFDVIYLAPIHPIGLTHRKGKNNSLQAKPGDPGSPWAIGNADGGHDAVDPALGTVEDFEHFVKTARSHGIEIALDFAAQCSPDHPWVTEHPEWFKHRPDGTIKYAENPPKKYEDIYPLDFDSPAHPALWRELRRVLQVWIDRGVTIFRVDNPHTKAMPFWEWCLADVHAHHPDIIFLAEAFTRPATMRYLAKIGFSQSYTYITWRNSKWELTDYLNELTQTEMAEYYRPNFFANTPDINPVYLQQGGRAAFLIRTVVCGTLSPTWGIASGFELCEAAAVPRKEEYLHSEKYEIKPRDWNALENVKDWISRVNRARRDNPALQELTNLTFYGSSNDQILFFGKTSSDGQNTVLVAVSLDPHGIQQGMVYMPVEDLGLSQGSRFAVQDYLTGERYEWGGENFVRLSPERPAHILRVERRS